MTDWRDAYNRMAKRAADQSAKVEELESQLGQMQAKLDQHVEAIALWDALEMRPGDQLTKAVLIAKVYDFDKGHADISTSATDDTDWVDQLGLFEAWRTMNLQTPIVSRDD